MSPYGATNAAPSINIVSPFNNQQFGDHAHILIQAQASDADGSIAKVEFYQNSVKLGEDLAAPYEYTWDHPAEGNYILSAKAYDDKNASSTSSPVSIKVQYDSAGCAAEGKILREFWNGVSGDKVTLIPFHLVPSGSEFLTQFEGPQNSADNYGSRIRGYVCPPITGTYYFWISSNDNGELWLSSNDNPATKIKIATVPTYSNFREWAKSASQKSAGVTLIAGQKYYIEALHKEGVNSDHISVGWQLPDGTLERPIPGSRLSPASVAAQCRLVKD